MTRQGFENIINDIGRNRSYPLKHKLQYLLAHDQAQRDEIARLREALEEANKQLISTAAGTDEFGGLLRRIRIALAKEATRDNAE